MASNYIWVAVCLLIIQLPDFLTKSLNRRPLDVWIVNPTPMHHRLPHRLLPDGYDLNNSQYKGKRIISISQDNDDKTAIVIIQFTGEQTEQNATTSKISVPLVAFAYVPSDVQQKYFNDLVELLAHEEKNQDMSLANEQGRRQSLAYSYYDYE